MGKMTYKIDVLDMLKKEGYTQTTLRKEKLIGQDAIQKMRKGEMIGIDNGMRITGYATRRYYRVSEVASNKIHKNTRFRGIEYCIIYFMQYFDRRKNEFLHIIM